MIEKIESVEGEIQDKVVFMTAYNIHKYKRHLIHSWRKDKNLLTKHHIAGISCGNAYVSPDIKCHYAIDYDYLNRVTSIYFKEVGNLSDNDNSDLINNITDIVMLHHTPNSLLDSSQVEVSMCIDMESFHVTLKERIFQVNAVAFVLNGSLIVNFTLVDSKTGNPIEYDEVYGRENNYAIYPISKIKYINDLEFIDDSRKISDVIFYNIFDFMLEAGKNQWEVKNFSFVHNMLIVSNRIENAQMYFQNILGAKIENFKVNNISASPVFQYYSTESLGVVTQVDADKANHILYDCMMLESFKSYLLLNMIVDYEIINKLDKVVKNQFYVESLFYPCHVPIITLNVINNLKNTATFSRYQEAIEFKIKALNAKQNHHRMNNGRLLNVLLYILAVFGSIQALQSLETEFGLPFNITFGIVMAFFAVLGLVWIFREFKK